MNTAKSIKCTNLRMVKAVQKFIATYFDDSVRSVNISSSEKAKSAKANKRDKSFYVINFITYETGEIVPGFLGVENYASVLQKEFSEWLGDRVSHLKVDWNLQAESDKSSAGKVKPSRYSFEMSIELRI